MKGFKQTVFSAAASVALSCLPVAPAAAHQHYYGGPCIVGNVLGAVATLVTLPLVMASAAVSALQPQAAYAPAPGYYAAPAASYNAPSGYYAPPPAYYARSPAYYAPPQNYYRSAPPYAAPTPRYYAPRRGYYAARPSYSGTYGAPGRSVYRGW